MHRGPYILAGQADDAAGTYKSIPKASFLDERGGLAKACEGLVMENYMANETQHETATTIGNLTKLCVRFVSSQ